MARFGKLVEEILALRQGRATRRGGANSGEEEQQRTMNQPTSLALFERSIRLAVQPMQLKPEPEGRRRLMHGRPRGHEHYVWKLDMRKVSNKSIRRVRRLERVRAGPQRTKLAAFVLVKPARTSCPQDLLCCRRPGIAQVQSYPLTPKSAQKQRRSSDSVARPEYTAKADHFSIKKLKEQETVDAKNAWKTIL